MLLIGFGAGMHRSELVAQTVGDVTIVPERGLTVFVAHVKLDQQGEGRLIAIHSNPKKPAFCPVVAFQRWGAVRTVGPTGAGHPLRRGFLTDAGDRQEQLRDVMLQSRHVKVETALGYMEDAET